MGSIVLNLNFVAVCATLFLVSFALANAQRRAPSPPISSPTPAPAPATKYVNLADLLSVAGPYNTFLNYLNSTGVIETLQNQANSTEGITLFVPEDKAFSFLKKPYPSLSNLTQDQLKSLCLFHALPHYYPLSVFTNLSQQNPIPTLAGGSYTLNVTDNMGTIRVNSGWTQTTISSAVHAADPVAIYQVNRVLLPEALFGTDIPPVPPPAPAPKPEIAPAASDADADAPSGDRGRGPAPSSQAAFRGRGRVPSSQFANAASRSQGTLFLSLSSIIPSVISAFVAFTYL